MRSTQNTRRQLLDIAISEFARNGFEKTSVRSIAKAAGTSPALVIHYFDSKDALVREAIRTTLGEFIGEEKAALLKDPETSVGDWIALAESGETRMMFFRQVLLADNEYTESLFTQALSETKGLINQGLEAGILQPLVDVDASSALLTAQAMANIIFLPQLERSLGGKLTDPAIASRLMVTQQELMPFTRKPKQEKANQ